jgi:hypothetical protein
MSPYTSAGDDAPLANETQLEIRLRIGRFVLEQHKDRSELCAFAHRIQRRQSLLFDFFILVVRQLDLWVLFRNGLDFFQVRMRVQDGSGCIDESSGLSNAICKGLKVFQFRVCE